MFRINLPGTKADHGRVTPKVRRWRIFWSYLPDWVLTIFLWGILYLLDKIDGYRRLFSVTDESLAYPYAEDERIPVWMLAVICGIVPAVLMIIIGGAFSRSFWDVHSALLGFILNLGLTLTFTNIIKITVGRPRPDLFSRCGLPENLTENPVHGLTSWTVCTRTDKLQEGFRSFPSGHSSFAWAGMWYSILYTAGKMRISNKRGHTWKAWTLLAPLCCAFLVCISRLMDYRHHAGDVIAGSIIGIVSAWFAYRQFYPPLSHHQAYKPYSPRVPKDDEEIPLHSKIDPRSSTEVITSALLQPQAGTHPAPPQQVDGNGYRDEFAAVGLNSQQEASYAQRYPATSSGLRQDPRLGATSAASGESDSHLLRSEAR